MDASTGEEPPLDSTDVAGWKRVVAGSLLDRLPLEAIAAALQDLRLNTDLGLRNDLAKNLSDRVYRLLRRQVGRNHPNEGWDIIDRVHVQVFEALAQPSSADAKGLRQAFVPRVLFRLKDAIAKEARERRIPDEIMVKPQEAAPADPPGGDGQEVEFDDANRQSDVAEAAGPPDGDDAPPAKARWNPTLLDGVRATDQQIDTDRFLAENITDDQKRLAFRLYMDDVPFKSKKHHSIAKALGIDEKTARLWIEEIKAQLKEKIGDLT
jgi:DNA-directed RNA polymerase specialized sigma24 family protein